MKNMIRKTCGDLALNLLPTKRNSILNGEIIPTGQLDRLIHESLIRKAANRGDDDQLRKQLAQFWRGSAGTAFYESFSDRFEDSFLGEHYPMVESLIDTVANSGHNYDQLIEVGCGDGRVLDHLQQKLPNVQKFTGLDINEGIIARNRENYSSDRLDFVNADASVWLRENFTTGSILVTYGGVLEYFLENELRELFTLFQTNSPAIVALVEPIYDDFDPEIEITSRSSGAEHSFSHNYRNLLETAGFSICLDHRIENEFRWSMIVARA